MMDITTYCDIYKCEECPRYGDDCDGDKRVEHTDLISRADAIDCCECHGSQECKDRIKALPSADAVQGEWIKVEDDYDNIYWECSNCEDAFVLEVGTPKDNNYNFCPNCGARMKGGDTE